MWRGKYHSRLPSNVKKRQQKYELFLPITMKKYFLKLGQKSVLVIATNIEKLLLASQLNAVHEKIKSTINTK